MQTELLKELVRHIAGKTSDIIVDILQDKRDINEFKIADKLKLTINQTRHILYKLFANEIVSFIRKKDKKKGWYIYYWTLNVPKAIQRFITLKKKEMNEMKNMIKVYENKHFYICQNCSIELNEENAMHHNFICPECGQLLQLDTHDKKLQELKQKIEQSEKQLKIAEEENSKLAEEQITKYEKQKVRTKAKQKLERKKKKEKIKKQEKRAENKKKKSLKKAKKIKKKKR